MGSRGAGLDLHKASVGIWLPEGQGEAGGYRIHSLDGE